MLTHKIKKRNLHPLGRQVFLPQPMLSSSIRVYANGRELEMDPVSDATSSLVASDRLGRPVDIALAVVLREDVETVDLDGISFFPEVSSPDPDVVTRSVEGTARMIQLISDLGTEGVLSATTEAFQQNLSQDPSGSAPENRVVETHTFPRAGTSGVIKPANGIFFQHGLRITHRGRVLMERADYDLIPIPATTIARVCGMSHTLYDQIRIENPDTHPYDISIQAFGGMDCQSRLDMVFHALDVMAKKVLELSPIVERTSESREE